MHCKGHQIRLGKTSKGNNLGHWAPQTDAKDPLPLTGNINTPGLGRDSRGNMSTIFPERTGMAPFTGGGGGAG